MNAMQKLQAEMQKLNERRQAAMVTAKHDHADDPEVKKATSVVEALARDRDALNKQMQDLNVKITAANEALTAALEKHIKEELRTK